VREYYFCLDVQTKNDDDKSMKREEDENIHAAK
jgi:hypothetical protein